MLSRQAEPPSLNASIVDPNVRDQPAQARVPSEPQREFDKLNKELEPLCQEWLKRFAKTFGPPLPELPPLREVNHHIPLIDPDA